MEFSTKSKWSSNHALEMWHPLQKGVFIYEVRQCELRIQAKQQYRLDAPSVSAAQSFHTRAIVNRKIATGVDQSNATGLVAADSMWRSAVNKPLLKHSIQTRFDDLNTKRYPPAWHLAHFLSDLNYTRVSPYIIYWWMLFLSIRALELNNWWSSHYKMTASFTNNEDK